MNIIILFLFLWVDPTSHPEQRQRIPSSLSVLCGLRQIVIVIVWLLVNMSPPNIENCLQTTFEERHFKIVRKCGDGISSMQRN